MTRMLPLILITLTLTACSSTPNLLGRSPSSHPESCETLVRELVVSRPGPSYKLSDFDDLDTSFIAQEPTLQRLVDLHEAGANREETRIALALLKEKHPDLPPRELARRYVDLLSDCSF